MAHNFFHNVTGLLQNPIQSYQNARQPGGLLAPVTSMNQFLGDPRVHLGFAIADDRPIGDALVQSAQIQEALAPEADTARESKIKGMVTRLQSINPNLTDIEALNKATDIVDGNLEIQLNPDAKTF